MLWALVGRATDTPTVVSSIPIEDQRALSSLGKLAAWKHNPGVIAQECERVDPTLKSSVRSAYEQWGATNRVSLQMVDYYLNEIPPRLTTPGNFNGVDPAKAIEADAVKALRQSFSSVDEQQKLNICRTLSEFFPGIAQEVKPMLDEAIADLDAWLKSHYTYRTEEQIISVPSEGWRIRFDAPKLVPIADHQASIFYGQAERFQLSFFVEKPRCSGGDSDENIYECFIKTLKQNPIADWDSERANTLPNGILVMYMAKLEREGQVGRSFNMHLLFAHRGKWADVHCSFAAPTKDDVNNLFAIIKSIKIEDEPPVSQ
jgi:hypothetical protein